MSHPNGWEVRMMLVRRLLIVALLATVAVLVSAGGANAAVPKALINADTVSGAPSQEESIATAQGFAVTVVSDADWGTMTASDFGQYDLLIAGDPTCGILPPGLISSASVYGPVVLGLAGGRTSAGNRIAVGTDPVFHDGGDYTSPDARGTIIREGIAYAGSQAGTTGMYFDSTCAAFEQSAEILAILEALSAGSGAWTIDALPPCGGSVSLIASNPSFADLTTASLQGWECSVHESFPTFRSDWSALAVATDTTSTPTCGVDPGTGLNACGEAYILIAGSSIVVGSQRISVSPLDSTNPVGTSHTVTANVHEVGGTPPVAGQLVGFTVTGQNAGASGTCVPVDCKSDVSGNVSFTYSDGAGAGDDTIKASFTDGVGSLQTATAQKHWVSGSTQTLTVSKDGNGSGTLASSPSGIDCGATCSHAFAEGTSVTVNHTQDPGSDFTGWSGDCTGTGTCTVTMDQARSVTATFTLQKHTLTVTKAGNSTGTVQSAPTGIDCGATCSAQYDHGTSVTLTGTPDANTQPVLWSGCDSVNGSNQCIVSMSGAKGVTATFNLVQYTLTVGKSGTGSGTVTSVDGGINCGASCSHNYDIGSPVTLNAQAAAGSTFAGWSGDCTGTGGCAVTMDQARSVTATFNLNPVVTPPGGGVLGTESCDGKAATIVGTEGPNNITGTKGADVIVSLGGKDHVNAGRGNDTVCAGDGKDHVVGGPGNDDEFGEGGNDHLIGNKGNDDLTGGPGTDKCQGGSGNNSLHSCEA